MSVYPLFCMLCTRLTHLRVFFVFNQRNKPDKAGNYPSKAAGKGKKIPIQYSGQKKKQAGKYKTAKPDNLVFEVIQWESSIFCSIAASFKLVFLSFKENRTNRSDRP